MLNFIFSHRFNTERDIFHLQHLDSDLERATIGYSK